MGMREHDDSLPRGHTIATSAIGPPCSALLRTTVYGYLAYTIDSLDSRFEIPDTTLDLELDSARPWLRRLFPLDVSYGQMMPLSSFPSTL